jgi:hypothetical protein
MCIELLNRKRWKTRLVAPATGKASGLFPYEWEEPCP